MGLRKTADRRIVYKSLREDGKSTVQYYQWPLPDGDQPGDWVELKPDEKPELCRRGPHGWLTLARAKQDGAKVFEMELEGDVTDDGEKAVGRRGRLLRQVAGRAAFTLGQVGSAYSGASPSAGSSAESVIARSLRVRPSSLESAIPADLYVIDEAGALVTLRRYIKRIDLDVDSIERRLRGLDQMPLTLEMAS